MKLTGLTAQGVDEIVDNFTKMMLIGMNIICKGAADHIKSFALTADGASDGDVSFAVDSLGAMTTQWGTYVDEYLMPALANMAIEAGQALASPLGNVHVPDAKTEQYLQHMHGWVTELAGEMWQTAKNAIITGAQDGESIGELASRVEQVAQVKAKKAHTIAQTAVIAAINGGEWQQMMEFASHFKTSGTKEWVSTHDSHTRPTHHEADGQVVPIDAHFVVGGEFLMFPGDPSGTAGEVANCRCTVAYELAAEDQITASQTSLETHSVLSVVVDNGHEIADSITAAVNADFNAKHPRGKDGKFIEKGHGLPVNVFDLLVKAKHDLKWDDFGKNEKQDFIHSASQISSSQWDNLKDEDQKHIKDLVENGLNDGLPGASKAALHLEDLDGEGDDEEHDVFNPHVDLTPAKKVAPAKKVSPKKVTTTSAPTSAEVHLEMMEAKKKGDITAAQYNFLLDHMQKGKSPGAVLAAFKTMIKDNEKKKKNEHTAPPHVSAPAHTPPTPTSTHEPAPTHHTTGSSEPIKITHGLIHAKHNKGDVIAQTDHGVKITWNGNSYDITDNGDPLDSNVKKSKLYALLNGQYSHAKWVKPGKQETEVTHAAPLDAAPPAEPIPHPTASTPVWTHLPNASSTSDALDEAFGPLNTGLAPAPAVSTPPKVYVPSAIADALEVSSPSAVDHEDLAFQVNNDLTQEMWDGFTPEEKDKLFKAVEAHENKGPANQDAFEKVVGLAGGNAPTTATSESWNSPLSGTVDTASLMYAAQSEGYPAGTDLAHAKIPGTNQVVTVKQGASSEYVLVNSTGTHKPDEWELTHLNEFAKIAHDSGITHWETDAPGSVSSPTTLNTPTVIKATDIDASKKQQFYQHFKAEKVSPAWSGAKIYASMHAAKAKMSGDPQIAVMQDDEMLKMLDIVESDKKAQWNNNAYEKKVKEWLKTPNGQKAFKQLNPAIATPTPSVAKKAVPTNAAKKAAKKAVPSGGATQEEALGTFTGAFSDAEKAGVYGKFKGSTYGKYLADDPAEIFWNAKKLSDEASAGTTVMDVLHVIDEKGAEKFGVPNAKSFEEKVTKWVNTPAGSKKAKQILEGTWAPSSPSYSYTPASTNYTHAADLQLEEKVSKVDTAVPAWDPNTSSSDFKVISTHEAASLWEEMQQKHGTMKGPEKTALKWYTTNEGYGKMNRYLRGTQGADDKTAKAVQDAQAGMRPSTKPILIHRGNGWFTDGAGNQWNSYENILKQQGSTFHQQAFFSTSVGGSAAFGGNIKFEIECPVGTPMAYVKAFSHYGGENEMLLAANLRYKVVKVDKGPGHYGGVVVRLRVISDEEEA